MNRRLFVSTGTATIVTLLTGCQALRSSPEKPDFSITSARTHHLSNGEFVATVHLEKNGGGESVAHLRWEIDVGEYVQATEEKFVIPKKVPDKTVALFVGASSDSSPETVGKSRVKLIREEFMDSKWITAELQTD